MPDLPCFVLVVCLVAINGNRVHGPVRLPVGRQVFFKGDVSILRYDLPLTGEVELGEKPYTGAAGEIEVVVVAGRDLIQDDLVFNLVLAALVEHVGKTAHGDFYATI